MANKMEVENALANGEGVICEVSAPMAAGILGLQDAFFKDHSFDYVFEQALEAGIATLKLRKKQALELKAARSFAKAVAENPANAVELAKRFGFGSSK